MSPALITVTHKAAVKIGGRVLGFEPKDASLRSLRAAGVMALLCASAITYMIRFVGRWRSDKMLCYLHVQAEPLMRKYSKLVVSHSNYKILLHMATIPCF